MVACGATVYVMTSTVEIASMYRLTAARIDALAGAVQRALDEGEHEHAQRVADLSYMFRDSAAGELRVAAVYAMASVSARLEGCVAEAQEYALDAEHYIGRARAINA